MYEDQILEYAQICKIPNFRGVLMRDELLAIKPVKVNECGILNLNRHDEQGSHWTAWIKQGKNRFWFDSFGMRPPVEVLKYLKTPSEYNKDKPVIKCNAVTVQHYQSEECGALSLYVIVKLLQGHAFDKIIQKLQKRFQKSAEPPPLKLSL